LFTATPPPRAGRRYTVPSGGQYWIYDCSIDA
jgi:hypothetical protein